MPKTKTGPVTLINFVLDKSGSMDVIREATISGFNEFLGDQVKQPGKTLFSLTTFDTRFDVRFVAVPVAQVPKLDMASYEPDGMTALYDAIAYSVHGVDDWIAGQRRKPDKVLFVIMTDGEENSSREYTQAKVFALIKQHQDERDYEFIYLGANQDAYAVGETLSIKRTHSRRYSADAADTRHSMRVVSAGVASYRAAPAARVDQWFTPEIEAEADARDLAEPPK